MKIFDIKKFLISEKEAKKRIKNASHKFIYIENGYGIGGVIDSSGKITIVSECFPKKASKPPRFV